MHTFALTIAIASSALWLLVLVLPWRPWLNGQTLTPTRDIPADLLKAVTVLIPARNEAEVIAATLKALSAQGSRLKVIVVDDASTDDTAAVARRVEGLDLQVIEAAPLPSDWSGKLWALEQGFRSIDTPYTLLLDADIVLEADILGSLLDKAQSDNRQFVSVMASLRMTSFWEKLLMPAFIYFFKLLYPFHLANSANRGFASAAGGCILLETRLLLELGGFCSIRGELIDDCALAKRVKIMGYRTWTGQSRSVVSLRQYRDLESIWDMVARTAFTQLRYSGWLLGVCTVLMVIGFWAPLLVIGSSEAVAGYAGLAYFEMVLTYVPTLLFYECPVWWALVLPFGASLYLAMTWTSAIRYWRGQRSRWKDRVYSPETES